MKTRTPKIGEIVLFQCNPDDSIAKSNHNEEVIPAIVTRVWSDICVNLKIVPDCGPMQDRTSVVHQSANPAGYHFQFQDEFYNPEKSIYDAKQMEECAGADERLIAAVNKLQEESDLVADYVETARTSKAVVQ